jgi:hypothetical protein
MKKRGLILLILMAIMGPAANGYAMNSTNFKLDWFVPLTAGSVGSSQSTHFALNFTLGQTVVGPGSSDQFKAGLGFWYGGMEGVIQPFRLYLPLIERSSN